MSFPALQFALIAWCIAHDWIPMPPLNDLAASRRAFTRSRRLLETTGNAVPLLVAFGASLSPSPVAIATTLGIHLLYGVGTLRAWWIPWLAGSSAEMKAAYACFHGTHRFLPARGDNVVPNTAHVFLHAMVWACVVAGAFRLAHAIG